MHVSTNPAMVWKQVADESQHSARIMARVSIGLLILAVLIGGYAYSEHRRRGEICQAIRSDMRASNYLPVQQSGLAVLSSHCS